jgi:hypothetical protein
MDGLGLRAIKPDRKDRALDLTEGQLEHCRWVICQREEPGAGLTRRPVFSSQAEETGDEDPEGIVI